MGDRLKAGGRGALVAGLIALLASCGGGGGNGGGGGGGGGTTTTVSGKITFDRVPVTDSGLKLNSVSQQPAREVVVEALRASNGSVLDSTTTNSSGNYSLTVPTDTSIVIRAKAQMTQTGSGAKWNFRVLNNTNANALYVLDSASFNSGSAASTHNLNAGSGWTGTAYVDANRAAAPFAILDTVYQAKQLLLSAQSSLEFPALDLFWAPANKSTNNFCPSNGSIGTTSFVIADSGDTDDCTTPKALSQGIYVLGFFTTPSNSDTDEFDQHVIAHEFGHYVEASFSRSDSIGGPHGFGEALDMRVAFSEGWGDAFSGMVLDDPLYRDSFGTTSAGTFDLDDNSDDINGWYSEAAVSHILWDLFDSGAEGSVDNVQVPFSTMFSVFSNVQKNTPALTSIFTFSDAVIAAEDPAAAQAIDTLLTSESVNGTDAYGANEFDFNSASSQPPTVYVPVTANSTPIPVCTNAAEGVYNKLNNRRFLRLELFGAGTHSVMVAGASVLGGTASTNTQVIVWDRGEVLASSNFNQSTATKTLNNLSLSAATYVIEVFDGNYGSISGTPSSQQRCMNVTVN